MSRALQLSRQLSQRAVMEAVLQSGPISRPSLAKQTGLSKQTVSEIMRLPEEASWVVETGRTAGQVGRSAVTYEVVPDAAFVAAVDLGGTKVRIGLSDLRGTIVVEAAELTCPAGGQAVVDQIARLCRDGRGGGRCTRADPYRGGQCARRARSGDRPGAARAEHSMNGEVHVVLEQHVAAERRLQRGCHFHPVEAYNALFGANAPEGRMLLPPPRLAGALA